ncbi:HV103 protein, partial [Trogon melanurus]|nr:HV103 protein [Trogon melanurus]NXJ87221.1 HV103 protein [Trogon melanurus]
SWSDDGLFFLTAAVIGQVALDQHVRELAVREGEGVTLQCSVHGGSMSNYIMHWYRQGSQGTMAWIYWGTDHNERTYEARFKGRVESSRNKFTL